MSRALAFSPLAKMTLDVSFRWVTAAGSVVLEVRFGRGARVGCEYSGRTSKRLGLARDALSRSTYDFGRTPLPGPARAVPARPGGTRTANDPPVPSAPFPSLRSRSGSVRCPASPAASVCFHFSWLAFSSVARFPASAGACASDVAARAVPFFPSEVPGPLFCTACWSPSVALFTEVSGPRGGVRIEFKKRRVLPRVPLFHHRQEHAKHGVPGSRTSLE
jgi:hypothetical protein